MRDGFGDIRQPMKPTFAYGTAAAAWDGSGALHGVDFAAGA